MPSIGAVRRKAFRAALAVDDLSIAKWADANQVSYTHLQLVLHSKRSSQRVERAVDSYIGSTLPPFLRTVMSVLKSGRANAA